MEVEAPPYGFLKTLNRWRSRAFFWSDRSRDRVKPMTFIYMVDLKMIDIECMINV